MSNIIVNIDGINRLNESIKESYKNGKKIPLPELLESVIDGVNKYVLTTSKLQVFYEEGYPQIIVTQ